MRIRHRSRARILALLRPLGGAAAAACGGDAGGGAPMCVAPAADCDGDATNACETTLGTRDDCGGCGEVCDADQLCGATGCGAPALASLLETSARIADITYGPDGHVY